MLQPSNENNIWVDNYDSPVLEYSSYEQQVLASKNFIASVKTYCQTATELTFVENIEKRISDEPDINYITQAAISCFDYCVSEEIRVYAGDSMPKFTDPAAVYYRSDVYKQRFPVALVGVLTESLGYSPTDIIIGSQDQILSHPEANGTVGWLTPDLMYLVNKRLGDLEKPQPPCGVPRQELFRSLLLCGLNPMDGMDNSTESQKININQIETEYKRIYRLRSELGNIATSEILDNMVIDKIQIWDDIFNYQTNEGYKSVLSSSGTAANEAVIATIAQLSDKPAYIHPYWYYENLPSALKSFRTITEKLNDARIVLINLEPTNYFSFQDNPETPEKIISNFINAASLNTDEKYYLIIDATVNPLFEIPELAEKSLANLHIIKTVSATKHQNGGRNYFFGVIGCNDNAVLEQISMQQARVGGDIYRSQIIHFPTPEIGLLNKRRFAIKKINHEVAYLSNTTWAVNPHSFHSFIMPSDNLISSIAKDIAACGDEDKSNKKMKIYNEVILDMVKRVTLRYDHEGIEFGDSFGLPQTRVNTQGGPNEYKGVNLTLKLPRICPGYESRTEVIQHFTSELMIELDTLTTRLIEDSTKIS